MSSASKFSTNRAALHPQYRLILLLCAAVLLPQYSSIGLVLVHGLLLVACIATQTLTQWFHTVLRLKWLFVSIVVLYGWFTPGAPVWSVQGINMPTSEGLVIALMRFSLLSALVAAVMCLIKPLNANVVALALARLLIPLGWLGLNVNIFSQRLALTLASVSNMQNLLNSRHESGWLNAAGQTLADIEQGNAVPETLEQGPIQASITVMDTVLFFVCLLLLALLLAVPGGSV